MEARVDCTCCRQFLVTWRSETPRGCRLYGFEGVRLPSLVVLEATGEPCQGFDPRPRPEGDRQPTSAGTWIG